jgi:hypothetical protein
MGVLYSAYVNRQMTFDEPSRVEVYILQATKAEFEVDGRVMLKMSGGSYVPNDGTWFESRQEAVAFAIKILEQRMASFAEKIEELKKEAC